MSEETEMTEPDMTFPSILTGQGVSSVGAAASASEPALVNQAPTGLGRSGFDQAQEREMSPEFSDAIVVFQSAARLLWSAVQADEGCTMVECVFKHDGNCQCVDAYSALAAQAIPDDEPALSLALGESK